ncbi:terminase large subunit [Ochrobactrum phage vB_OspP_OH]|uniref:Terminase large subunit n=1 Tax=Ochrobactrum phage vB_OspP_OH TaxID=2712957 RepID=A0A6G6XXQ6_9CAUD|nr:terminase large subunit [Ochrobactrum phage vB_OspP_OH]QIG66114.1 terminase large subunit [Ochrobactrum phage vB_OspP_OH]
MNDAAPKTEARVVTIPYIPRRHFLPLHQSKRRFKFVVAHRRAGKSVAAINEMIKQALLNQRKDPPPRYGYVGPSFEQTKDLIWGYLKQFAGGIPGVAFSEGELTCRFPNGASIRLYGGAAAYERMRGLYFDGIMLDEFAMLNPTVFSTVVRPCLADYRGWAICSGTSAGDDHFHELKKRVEKDMMAKGEQSNWDMFIIPVTETDALHPDEVIEMTQDMSENEYAREMLCSFDAPIEGAYYGDLINDAKLKGRVCQVPFDPAALVTTWWDLGIDDYMCIWFVQRVGREIHVIDYYENSGKGLDFYVNVLNEKSKEHGYNYNVDVCPPDIRVRELGTGRSRFEVLTGLNRDVFVSPQHRVEDGIEAVRSILPMCYFDKEKTASGLSALQNYHRSKAGKPVHNWASHGADAFRYGAVSFDQLNAIAGAGNVTRLNGRLRRRVRGVR